MMDVEDGIGPNPLGTGAVGAEGEHGAAVTVSAGRVDTSVMIDRRIGIDRAPSVHVILIEIVTPEQLARCRIKTNH